MLNAREIIGFPEMRSERRFELIAELRRQRQAEIARLTEIAAIQKAEPTPVRAAAANAEAEIQRLLAEIAAVQNGQNDARPITVANRGK